MWIRLRARIRAYAEADQLQTSAITCFELLSGAKEGRRGEAVRGSLAALVVLPLEREAAERAAEVRRALESEAQPIGMGESLIAGICTEVSIVAVHA